MYSMLTAPCLKSRAYDRLAQEGPVEELSEKGISHGITNPERLRFCYLVLWAVSMAIAGATGYLVGTQKSHGQLGSEHPEGSAPQGWASPNDAMLLLTYLPAVVSIGTLRSIFQYNSSFAAPPPEEGGSEPVWDAMIPSKSDFVS